MGEAKQNAATNTTWVIHFMKQRFVAMAISAVLLLFSLGALVVNGLQLGLDFTGGLQIEAEFSQPAQLPQVRRVLADKGFKDATVVYFGSDRALKITTQQDRLALVAHQLAALAGLTQEAVTVASVAPRVDDRLPQGGTRVSVVTQETELNLSMREPLLALGLQRFSMTDISDNRFDILLEDGLQVVTEALLRHSLSAATAGEVVVKRTEFIGPQVGGELRDQGGIGLLFALLVVMIYVALRFQFKFSVGAVVALVHDVVIVLGFFALLRLDFDLTVLAAILAVIGYSLNDTIVVSDRIRENFRKIRKASPEQVIDQSLSQTLGRTLVTSGTTLLVLLALFFVGGELIHAFAIALMIGILVGTYSSIYVAANMLLVMNITKEDLMLPEKEGAEEQDDTP